MVYVRCNSYEKVETLLLAKTQPPGELGCPRSAPVSNCNAEAIQPCYGIKQRLGTNIMSKQSKPKVQRRKVHDIGQLKQYGHYQAAVMQLSFNSLAIKLHSACEEMKCFC
jgi:hypothetical protein